VIVSRLSRAFGLNRNLDRTFGLGKMTVVLGVGLGL
jgi:hypothetical protein